MNKKILIQIVAVVFFHLFFASTPIAAGKEFVLSQWRLSSDDGNPPVSVTLPAFLKDLLPDPMNEGNDRYYLETDVVLPENFQGSMLSLTFRDLPGLVSLSVNGQPVLSPEKSISELGSKAYRRSGPKRFRINPHLTANSHLTFQLAFIRGWPQSDYIPVAPRLSRGAYGDEGFHYFFLFQKFIRPAVTTMLILLGFLYITTFWLRPKDTVNLYLALQYTGAGIYMLFRLGILQLICGIHDGPVTLFFLSIAVTSGTFVTITVLQQKKISGLWFIPPFVLGVWGLFYQTPNTYFSSLSFLLLDIYIALGALFNIVLLVRLTILKRENALLFLIAWLSLEMLCMPEFLRYGLVFNSSLISVCGIELSEYSFIIFTIFQLVAHSRERSFLFSATEAMSTELQKKSEELELKNIDLLKADRLKDEFLANTSHELRTPLNGIIGIADSLISGAAGHLSETVLKNLSMISGSGKRLANLINDILDFSKLKNRDMTLNLQPVDVWSLTETVITFISSIKTDKPVSIKNMVPFDLPNVTGDEDRLQQVLYNLIGNAFKFTREGEIVVTATVEDGGPVQVFVSDTGVGIPPDQQESIFQPFMQADASISRSFEGAGLGLGISRDLIELHHGELWLESSSDKGSTFCFSLPVADDGRQGMEDRRQGAEDGGQRTEDRRQGAEGGRRRPEDGGQLAVVPQDSPRVLVVDDDPVNLQVVVNFLFMEQIHVTTASGGLEAKELYHSGHCFDLVLLDIMMPEISGLELCRWLRDKYSMAELPILLVTAKNRLSDLVEGLSCGANDYITKPFAQEELLARTGTHLKIKRAHEALKENIKLKDEIRRRKQTELGLRLNQRRMAGMLNTIQDALLAVNESGEICFCNSIFEEKFGYSAEKLLGKSVQGIFSKRSVQKTNEWIALMAEKEGFHNDQEKPEPLEIIKNGGLAIGNQTMKSMLTVEDEHILVLIIRPDEKPVTGHVASFEPPGFIIRTLNRNRERLKALENLLNNQTPETIDQKNDFQENLRLIDHALKQIGNRLVEPVPSQNKRELAVELLTLAVEKWCEVTGTGKPELAETSGLWAIYMNRNGHQRTQTLDKYLDIKTLPARPRWKQVSRTAEYVLECCDIGPVEKERMEIMLSNFRSSR